MSTPASSKQQLADIRRKLDPRKQHPEAELEQLLRKLESHEVHLAYVVSEVGLLHE